MWIGKCGTTIDSLKDCINNNTPQDISDGLKKQNYSIEIIEERNQSVCNLLYYLRSMEEY